MARKASPADIPVDINLDLRRYPAEFGDLAIRSWLDERGDWTAASFNPNKASYREDFTWPLLRSGEPARGIVVQGPSDQYREIMRAEKDAYEATVARLPEEVRRKWAAAQRAVQEAAVEEEPEATRPGPKPCG